MERKNRRSRCFFGAETCVQIYGNELVYLSRCRRILSYDEDHISADMGKLCVSIFGSGISADDNNTEGMTVHGNILQISFEEIKISGEKQK